MLDGQVVHLSFISELELLSYPAITPEAIAAIRAFLRECIIFDIQQEVKSHVIDLRRRYKFRLPDAIIAATSLFLQVPLLTADSDFMKVQELALLFYEP
jgi:predicted nucleic acid-binding protein